MNPSSDNSSEKLTSCHSILRKVGPYVDGELCLEECEEVAAHLARCQDCSRTATEFRDLDRLAEEKVPPVSGEDWSKLWERIRAQPPRALRDEDIMAGSLSLAPYCVSPELAGISERTSARYFARRGLQRWALPAAAAAAVLLGLFFIGFHGLDSPRVTEAPPKEPTENYGDRDVHVSGPRPVIQDDDSGTTLMYRDF
jgi:anti-sigma factor RsiW